MKRILLFIVIFILIGGGVWYFFLRPKVNPDGNPVANVFQSFFPINSSTDGSPDGLITDGTVENTVNENKFSQVTLRPIAGYSIFTLNNTLTVPNPDPKLKPITTTTTDHYIRYVSRTNGYVYEIKNTGQATQISNILIPNIYEALFANGNTSVLLRYLKAGNQTIATHTVSIPPLNPDGTRTQRPGVYLPDNIDSIAISPDGKQVARLTTDASGGVVSISTPLNTTKKDLIRTPFKEWLISWPTQSNVYVQTKASSTVNGFLYRIDSAAGKLRKVIGDVPGLTTSISPNGAYILYSQSTQNGFITKLFNTTTGTTSAISLSIMPEKCAWYRNNDLICAGNNTVPEGVYPDSWYAGITHFQDQLYRINVATNTYTVLSEESGRLFDMTHLQLDEGQNLLYFIDKPTGLLWKFNLNS